jgi:glycosyltransferase involved in cell wall biosynthesis
VRWVELAVATLGLLRRSRPKILFVQNPSLALTVLAVLSRPLFGYYLVVDAHNEGIRPFDRPYALIRWLTRRLLKSADVTIVSNEALAKDVHAAGGRSLILPDRLPVPPELQGARHHNSDTADVVVIATFRRDEPIAAIMAAAATMPGLRFAVSGPAERYREASGSVPPNVHLTGFLQDPAYWQLLAQATVICDLTLKPDCLVCGAYEALAVGKPMVLSDNPATRDIFGPAAVLTGNSPEEIATAVRTAIGDRERLEASALKLREAFQVRWQMEADAVWGDIEAQFAAGTRPAA